MKYTKVYLKELNENVGNDAYFEIYKADENCEISPRSNPALVVIPGGAYQFCSQREAEPVALRFCSEGFVVFVLHYTCNVPYPLPHYELSVLLDYINKKSSEFNLIKNCTTLLGFSAGGHLSASYCCLYHEFEKQLNLKNDELKPFAQILSYPVTSMVLDTQSMTKAIITNECDPTLVKKLNTPDHVDSNYPPTYIWATKKDQCVPYEHSLQLIEALKKHNVSYQFDLFEIGIHGGSLCNHAVYDNDFNFDEILNNRIWVQNAVEFIYKLI